jgi:hypothetical protein
MAFHQAGVVPDIWMVLFKFLDLFADLLEDI